MVAVGRRDALPRRHGQARRAGHVRRRRRRDGRQPRGGAVRAALRGRARRPARRAGRRDGHRGRPPLRERRRAGRRRPPRRSRASATCSRVPATGAYCYTMANNYNGTRRIPVVFAADGAARGGGPPRDLGGPARRATSTDGGEDEGMASTRDQPPDACPCATRSCGASPSPQMTEETGTDTDGGELSRSIGLFQLTMFGVGATIGTGIFIVLTAGRARRRPGGHLLVRDGRRGRGPDGHLLRRAGQRRAGVRLLVLLRLRDPGRGHRHGGRGLPAAGVRRRPRPRSPWAGRSTSTSCSTTCSASRSRRRSPRRRSRAACSTCRPSS